MIDSNTDPPTQVSEHTVTDKNDLTGLPVLFPSDETLKHLIHENIVEEAAKEHDVQESHLHAALNALTEYFDENRNQALYRFRRLAEYNKDMQIEETDYALILTYGRGTRTVFREAGIDSRYHDAIRTAHNTLAEQITDSEPTTFDSLVIKKSSSE